MLTESAKSGGIVHAIHPRLVPHIIARCGMRWWNAACNPCVTSVVREVVVKNNLGNFGPSYDMLRKNKPDSEGHLLARLRTSHSHTAKQHHFRAAATIAKLFRETTDPAVNWVKFKVFGIENGAPLLADDHPLMKELKDALRSGEVLGYTIQV